MFSSNPFSRFWSSPPSNSANDSNGSSSTSQPRDASVGEGEDVLRLVVKWGKDRFNIPVPRPQTTPLSTLINTLSAHTSVPASQLKLISNGAVLRNPALPLAAYGLKDGSTIIVVGSKDQPAVVAAGADALRAGGSGGRKGKEVVPTTEPELKAYVEEKKAFLDGLAKDIAAFEEGCGVYLGGQGAADPPSSPSQPTFAQLQQSHARLSELLLQGLLRLDGIEIPPDLDGARQARKAAIKQVQKELDRVDGRWAEVKARPQ